MSHQDPAEGEGRAGERDDLDQMLSEVAADPLARGAYEDLRHREELLKSLIRERRGHSQSAVAAAMGTTQSAVSDIENGRVDPRLSTLQRYARAIGRRLEARLRSADESGEVPLSSDHCWAVGIELLPYRLVSVLIDGSGHPVAERQAHLADMEVDTVVRRVTEISRELLADSRGSSSSRDRIVLGLQLGGPVDTESGVVHFLSKHPPGDPEAHPGFKWEDVPLGSRLRRATGLETVILNDANALAQWENWFGVGRETANFAVMLIREGVGGSLVRRGTLFDGPVEIGNFIIHTFEDLGDYAGPLIESDAGYYGALETIAGTTAIIISANHQTNQAAQDIVEAAALADKDPRAVPAFRAAGVAMACGMGYMVGFSGVSHLVLYAPAVMLKEGRPAADTFLGEVSHFRDHIAFKAYRNCELIRRPFDIHTGAHGAALMALERCLGVLPSHAGVSAGTT